MMSGHMYETQTTTQIAINFFSLDNGSYVRCSCRACYPWLELIRNSDKEALSVQEEVRDSDSDLGHTMNNKCLKVLDSLRLALH